MVSDAFLMMGVAALGHVVALSVALGVRRKLTTVKATHQRD